MLFGNRREDPMSQGTYDSRPDRGRSVVTRQIASEAAVWVARLHGPDRSPRMERECIAWQAKSGAHRLAFEKTTDIWQDVARVTVSDALAATSRYTKRSRAADSAMQWIAARLRKLLERIRR